MLIGGPFSKFDLWLDVVGENVVPETVTELLGVVPTFSAAKGVLRPTKSGHVVKPTGVWQLRQSSFGAVDVGTAIEDFLARLPLDPSVWQAVARMGRTVIAVTVWLAEDHGSAELSPKLLAHLGRIGTSMLLARGMTTQLSPLLVRGCLCVRSSPRQAISEIIIRPRADPHCLHGCGQRVSTQRRGLHDEITGQDLDLGKIRDIAQEIKNSSRQSRREDSGAGDGSENGGRCE